MTEENEASISQRASLQIDLIAVLVAVTDGQPRVMTIRNGDALPSGPFEFSHRSLQAGLREWVEEQTGHPLGYMEQLYTFADRDRAGEGGAKRVVSISYLGLTREERAKGESEAGWRNWYDFFPWEDRRRGTPAFVEREMVPRLRAWAKAGGAALRRERAERLAVSFGLDGSTWNEELILQRYELMYEAGIVEEAVRAGTGEKKPAFAPGRLMTGDHRRILATGIARLRAKIKYRPVVFELLPPTFTLLQLQRAVEALAGMLAHKPNFRRLIEQQQLVEETGATATDAPGRPAKLFRFRREIFAERAVAGTKPPLIRA
jgi:hypothetical protein